MGWQPICRALGIARYQRAQAEREIELRDNTERDRIEAELSLGHTYLKTLIGTVPALICWKDADGRYLGCNPRFEQFFGAREADICGKTDYDFVDKELADLFRKHDRLAMVMNGSLGERGGSDLRKRWAPRATGNHQDAFAR